MLFGSAVLLKTDDFIAEKAVNHLNQRYKVIGTGDDIYFFERGNLSVGITADEELGLIIIYFPKTDSNNSGGVMNFKDRLDQIKMKSDLDNQL
tara:strand:+ start:577 stop:855 length:279 start_codon:yes stop_codon:yes gene_type:complete